MRVEYHLFIPVSWIAATFLFRIFKNSGNITWGAQLSDEEWDMAPTKVHSSSICFRHALIQFKVLHRLHFSKVKLARIFQNVDARFSLNGKLSPLHHTTTGLGTLCRTLSWKKSDVP